MRSSMVSDLLESLANKSQPPNAGFLEGKEAHGKQATMEEAKNGSITLVESGLDGL